MMSILIFQHAILILIHSITFIVDSSCYDNTQNNTSNYMVEAELTGKQRVLSCLTLDVGRFLYLPILFYFINRLFILLAFGDIYVEYGG